MNERFQHTLRLWWLWIALALFAPAAHAHGDHAQRHDEVQGERSVAADVPIASLPCSDSSGGACSCSAARCASPTYGKLAFASLPSALLLRAAPDGKPTLAQHDPAPTRGPLLAYAAPRAPPFSR